MGEGTSALGTENPEQWRCTVAAILSSMNVEAADIEAVNLLSLVMQHEACTLIRGCIEQARLGGRNEVTVVDARLAGHDYIEKYQMHPHLYTVGLVACTPFNISL